MLLVLHTGRQEAGKHIRISYYYNFRMAGNEEKLGRDVYISDESEGIIPRASNINY